VPTRVFLDGDISDENARISVFDRGFLYGDSVYEVTRTIGGRPVDLPRHLERFERSATAILLPLPTADEITDAVTATLAAAGNPDSYIRIVATRGGGKIGLDPALSDGTTLMVIVKPLELPPAEVYERGGSIALVSVRRNERRAVDPAVKSGNYLNNILAIAEARRRLPTVDEAIMCNVSGQVTEGSTSNVFVVKGGAIKTPFLEDGILDGITRRRVRELAPVIETHLYPGDLRDADEIFLTSSIRGVLPVSSLDGASVGSGAPGPVTRDLMEKYDAFLDRVRMGRD
jgi:branched-chain amino acid aminotransferase